MFDTLIEAQHLKHLVDAGVQAPLLVVIDCRAELSDAAAGGAAFLSAHIPGACHADLNRDLSGPVTPTSGRHPLPDPATFVATLGSWGVTDHSQIVAYDAANGAYAARLWWLARWIGHRAVAVLDGGFATWCAAGGTSESGEPPPRAPGGLTLRPGPSPTVTTAQIAATLHDPAQLIVDARAAERYAGLVEPIDAVAGHVPGAVNHPLAENLDTDGRFLPPAELRRRWQARLGGQAPQALIAMCGSGVTACHNLLALEVAGLRGAKLYPGSWSEWIRDAQRPVARGELP
jgi:thiosulfate/3-mercaptopyruvate sulfurtransferase